MASVIYHSALRDLLVRAIDADTNTFKGDAGGRKLHTGQGRPRQARRCRERRGPAMPPAAPPPRSPWRSSANDRVEIILGAVSWPSSSITARGLVYYKSRGGAASADELVAFIDFGEDVVSSNGAFAMTASTLRIQN